MTNIEHKINEFTAWCKENNWPQVVVGLIGAEGDKTPVWNSDGAIMRIGTEALVDILMEAGGETPEGAKQ